MAVLARTAVSFAPLSVNDSAWYEGGVSGKRNVARRLKFTAVSVGGATNTIGAAALGFATITGCENFFDTTNNKVIPAVVDPVHNVILLGAGSSLAVGDLSTVTGYMIVRGQAIVTP